MKVSALKKLVKGVKSATFNIHTGNLSEAVVGRKNAIFTITIDEDAYGARHAVTHNDYATSRFKDAIKALRSKDSAVLADGVLGSIPLEIEETPVKFRSEWGLAEIAILTMNQVKDAIVVAQVAEDEYIDARKRGVYITKEGTIAATNGYRAMIRESSVAIKNDPNCDLFLDFQAVKEFFPLFENCVSVYAKNSTWGVQGTIDGHVVRIQYQRPIHTYDFGAMVRTMIHRESSAMENRHHAEFDFTEEIFNYISPFAKIDGAAVTMSVSRGVLDLAIRTKKERETLARNSFTVDGGERNAEGLSETDFTLQSVSVAYLCDTYKTLGGNMTVSFSDCNGAILVKNHRYRGAIAPMSV